MEKLSFYKVEKKHLNLIHKWLSKEHVQEFFYGEGLQNTLRNLDLYVDGTNTNGRYFFDHWIAYSGDQPFGFLMTTPVVGPHDSSDNYNKWFEEGKETITLDILIGEEAFLGKGLAHRMIQEFLLDKFSKCSTVLIDPGASNAKAIHVYEKAGFKKEEQFLPKYDPIPHWMMRMDMDKLKLNTLIED